MSKIKTKDVVKGTIKTIDKAAITTERLKSAYAKTKERAETGMYEHEMSSDEYAANRVQSAEEYMVQKGIHVLAKEGHKATKATSENVIKTKDSIQAFKQKRMEEILDNQIGAHRPSSPGYSNTSSRAKTPIKTAQKAKKTIKQSARSAGRRTIKTADKVSAKNIGKSIKTAEKNARASIKTSKQAQKAAKRAADATIKNSKRAAQAAKQAAKIAVRGLRAATRATIAAIKGIIAGTKALISAIIAGGWVAVLIIIVICLVALIAGSAFGIFFSGESATGNNAITMRTVVQEINADYDTQIRTIKDLTVYDELEMSGSIAVWKEVLAVYAVKTNTDSTNPEEVATMNSYKKSLLSKIFWEMNEISHNTETKTETVIEETDDGEGNIIETEKTITKTILYITVSHKTVEDMSAKYGFNEEQKAYLSELLRDENNSLWSSVLYGIQYSNDQIVAVALSQIGNVGGTPYWSWYGFDSRVEWCACFVSWCANECGYIDTGIIPKYASCVNGVEWFKERGQWLNGLEIPEPGMIAFFDWNSPDDPAGSQDSLADHTGIVQKVEGGRVYTVEGNSGDSCRINSYPVGYHEILGYGVPAY